jgi:hypothetical protein
MQASPGKIADEEILNAYRAYLQAMADGDTDALDGILDGGFTLTHINGYVQPKAEWLSQMRAGQLVYHGVEERHATVEAKGDTARLVGRVVTDATVHGTRVNWRLQLAVDYARESDTWIALRSVATTW